jgi:hypothetical protein
MDKVNKAMKYILEKTDKHYSKIMTEGSFQYPLTYAK